MVSVVQSRRDAVTPTNYLAWDLDGTLVDMDFTHYRALNLALATCGPQAVITEEEHRTTFKGLPTTKKLDALVAAGRVPEASRSAVAMLKQANTIEAIRATLRPDPEKLAVLTAFKKDGWRQCVCSNAVRESVKEMLLAAGLIGIMDFYLSNEDAAPKPAPDIYLKAAKLWHVAPDHLVVVEDAAPGKAAARAAGCRLVEIQGPEDVTTLNGIFQRIWYAAWRKGYEPQPNRGPQGGRLQLAAN
jgi:beta-phosphoglucomutase